MGYRLGQTPAGFATIAGIRGHELGLGCSPLIPKPLRSNIRLSSAVVGPITCVASASGLTIRLSQDQALAPVPNLRIDWTRECKLSSRFGFGNGIENGPAGSQMG